MSNNDIMRTVSAFIVGIIFALGLIISEMVNPAKVHNFLDIFGTWDASLLFVMIGALVVTFIGYKLVFRASTPVFAALFRLPNATEIDQKLVGGAVIFGIGWGLVGLCPSPALVGMGLGIPEITVFVISLIVGINVYRIVVNFNRNRNLPGTDAS